MILVNAQPFFIPTIPKHLKNNGAYCNYGDFLHHILRLGLADMRKAQKYPSIGPYHIMGQRTYKNDISTFMYH